MPVVSSMFLVVALVLAVVIGPQTRPWTWGPSLMALAVSVLAAMPVIWKRRNTQADFGLLFLGSLTIEWFLLRAWFSPVAESGRADILLAAAALGTFVSVRAISGDLRAERVLAWGVALLLLANVVVIGIQIFHTTYAPVFRNKAGANMISGFFAHYNEAANFLIAASMLVGAAAIFGKHRKTTRLLWGLIALAALVAVNYTRSRGGILGAALACGVLFAMAMIHARRRDDKWFVPALIAVPLIGIGIGAFLLHGWMQAQEIRQAGSGLELLMDNNSRLYFLGIALSCIGLHPATGGGARSFSWECFRFAEVENNGDIITHRPEFVHNELVQSATDYGLAGTGLLVVLLMTLVLIVVLKSLFEKLPAERDHREAWRCGAIAAFIGMMIQSSFSFVFHLLPGVLLLAVCLAQMSRAETVESNAKTFGTRWILLVSAAASILLIVPAGWNGTRATAALWNTHYGKTAFAGPESKMDALTAAIAIWPHSSFFLERAALRQSEAGDSGNSRFEEFMNLALSDYHSAESLTPYDPSPVVNLANILGTLGRDSEAESAYTKAIALQGGMEPCFRARFSLANHYLRKSMRVFDATHPEASLEALELAAGEMESAVKEMHYVIKDMVGPRVEVHERLGRAREATGDFQGALESYNFASGLQGGKHVHHSAAVLIGKQAMDVWHKRRPSEALLLFTEARKRVDQARGELPAGVTPSMRLEFIADLDYKIAFLKGAKVEPK